MVYIKKSHDRVGSSALTTGTTPNQRDNVNGMDNPDPEALLLCARSRLLRNTISFGQTANLNLIKAGSLIEMYTALWIRATLVESLANLTLWAHYDNGNGGVTEAVF